MAAKSDAILYTGTYYLATNTPILYAPQSDAILITSQLPTTTIKTIGQLWPRGNC